MSFYKIGLINFSEIISLTLIDAKAQGRWWTEYLANNTLNILCPNSIDIFFRFM